MLLQQQEKQHYKYSCISNAKVEYWNSPSSCWSGMSKTKQYSLGAIQKKKVRPSWWRCYTLQINPFPLYVVHPTVCVCEHIRGAYESKWELVCSFYYVGFLPRPSGLAERTYFSPQSCFILLCLWLIPLLLQMHLGLAESEVFKYTIHLSICPGQRGPLFC